MYKTISINISGIIFNVNDEAYEILKNYLDKLHYHFNKTEEGKEVYSDIESRVAEIFSEIISNNNQVITLPDVNNLIDTLGKPEDFFDGDANDEEHEPENKKNYYKKRLYRDIDDKVLGGVASGLAYYFGIDKTIIRILFIVLFMFGSSGFWIYLILWIAMPEAKTSSQKLEMKGEPINISNIEKNIKTEFENVKNNIKSKKYDKIAGNFFEKIIHIISTIIKGLLKAFGSIIGLVFVILGVTLLSVIVGSYIFDSSIIQINEFGINTLSITEILNFITTKSNINYLIISFLVIITIPIFSILYTGIKLLLNIKTSNKLLSLILFIMLIFGSVIFSISIIDIVKNFSKDNYTISETFIDNKSDTIFLATNLINDTINGDNIIFSDDDDDLIITKNNIFISPSIKILNHNNDSIIVKIKRKARGENKNTAKENLEQIYYNWNFKNDTLNFDSHFIIKDKFRDEDVKIKIYKPKNVEIKGLNKYFIN